MYIVYSNSNRSFIKNQFFFQEQSQFAALPLPISTF